MVTDEILTSQAAERLKVLHEAYRASSENYMMQSTRLNLQEWSKKYLYRRNHDDEMDVLSKNNAALVRLGTRDISRAQVFDVFSNYENGQASVLEAFVATMAWGFKPDSYGPYRTSVMLSKPRKDYAVQEVLESVAAIDDPITAYRAMINTLEGLGPAFGTKFLYFTSPSENRAPILDAVVAEWLRLYGVRDSKDKSITSVGWNTRMYERYVNLCSEACDVLGIEDRGLVEYLMFVDSQYSDYIKQGTLQPDWVSSVRPLGWPQSR